MYMDTEAEEALNTALEKRESEDHPAQTRTMFGLHPLKSQRGTSPTPAELIPWHQTSHPQSIHTHRPARTLTSTRVHSHFCSPSTMGQVRINASLLSTRTPRTGSLSGTKARTQSWTCLLVACVRFCMAEHLTSSGGVLLPFSV